MKFCTQCGKQLTDDAKFCTGCGMPCASVVTQITPTMQATHKKGMAWDHLQKYGYLMKRAAGGFAHTVAIMYDDTVRVCGGNGRNQCDCQHWTHLKTIVCTGSGTIGLKNDGSVIWCGMIPFDFSEVNSWGGTRIEQWPSTIVDLSASIGNNDHVLGLSSDGHVYAFGGNTYGQCNVQTWCDIVEIAACHALSVGVRKDGTVVTCGDDGSIKEKVSKWQDIEHIYVGLEGRELVGLKYDGTVVTTANHISVSGWRNIINICCDVKRIMGLTGNGEVYFAGNVPNEYIQQGKSGVLACYAYMGFVLTTQVNGGLLIESIHNSGKVMRITDDHPYVAFGNGFYHLLMVRDDGALGVSILSDLGAPVDETQGWTLFKQKIELTQEEIYIRQNKCTFCGGEFKGLFTLKCSQCGRKKNY